MPVITFNGKTYADVNEMPEAERRAFEEMTRMFADENGNGIPDLLEGDMVKKVLAVHASNMNVNVNGQTYHSLEELPPDLRQSVDSAFMMLSSMGLTPKSDAAQTSSAGTTRQAEAKPSISPQSSSAIEEDKGSSTFTYVIIGLVLCFALAVAAFAVTYFMIR